MMGMMGMMAGGTDPRDLGAAGSGGGEERRAGQSRPAAPQASASCLPGSTAVARPAAQPDGTVGRK
jgi:hypothetical protein